jgi:hypothetical protein
VGILAAFGALRGGGNIDLTGATGRMDFDPVTGEAPVDFTLVCAEVDASGKAVGGADSGVLFDVASGRWSGPLECP